MCWHSTKYVLWGSFGRFHVTFSHHLLIIWMKDCIIWMKDYIIVLGLYIYIYIGNYLSLVNFISSNKACISFYSLEYKFRKLQLQSSLYLDSFLSFENHFIIVCQMKIILIIQIIRNRVQTIDYYSFFSFRIEC